MDHEFTHAAVLRGLGATSLPTWLAEGTASYGDNGGYFWSYTIVDLAMATYGRDTLRPWLDNRGRFDPTFGVSDEAFRARWVEYLKAHCPAAGDGAS